MVCSTFVRNIPVFYKYRQHICMFDTMGICSPHLLLKHSEQALMSRLLNRESKGTKLSSSSTSCNWCIAAPGLPQHTGSCCEGSFRTQRHNINHSCSASPSGLLFHTGLLLQSPATPDPVFICHCRH